MSTTQMLNIFHRKEGQNKYSGGSVNVDHCILLIICQDSLELSTVDYT